MRIENSWDFTNGGVVEEMKRIVEQWLKAYAYTVATNNVEAHLDMVSQQLHVIGISRSGFMEYTDWAKRRRNDIKKRRLARICYDKLALGTCDPDRLRFTVEETLRATEGDTYVMNKGVVLHREMDGKWRVIEEFIHSVRVLPISGALLPNQPCPAAVPGASD